LLTPIVESTYLNRDMCQFESSQKDESRWQSTDFSKASRNTSAFKCRFPPLWLDTPPQKFLHTAKWGPANVFPIGPRTC